MRDAITDFKIHPSSVSLISYLNTFVLDSIHEIRSIHRVQFRSLYIVCDREKGDFMEMVGKLSWQQTCIDHSQKTCSLSFCILGTMIIVYSRHKALVYITARPKGTVCARFISTESADIHLGKREIALKKSLVLYPRFSIPLKETPK